MPARSDIERRAQWVVAVEKHQKFDENRNVFNVCIRHFDKSNLYLRGGEYVLKLNAIPKIFNKANSATAHKVKIDNASKAINNNYVDNCVQECELLTTKVTELEKQIVSMKIQHDIEIQKLKIKSGTAREKDKVLLKTVKNELSKQKTQVLRLNDVIKELHEKHYISPEDVKFLNVSSKSRSSYFIAHFYFFSKLRLSLFFVGI